MDSFFLVFLGVAVICASIPVNQGCFEEGVAYPGNDLKGQPKKGDSAEACQELCQETSGCNAFTYWPSNRNCWLKAKKGQTKDNSRTVSGGVESCNVDGSGDGSGDYEYDYDNDDLAADSTTAAPTTAAPTTAAPTTAAPTTAAPVALWPRDSRRACMDKKITAGSKQIQRGECQELCDADSKCKGIQMASWPNPNSGYCYKCTTERVRYSAFSHFYKKPEETRNNPTMASHCENCRYFQQDSIVNYQYSLEECLNHCIGKSTCLGVTVEPGIKPQSGKKGECYENTIAGDGGWGKRFTLDHYTTWKKVCYSNQHCPADFQCNGGTCKPCKNEQSDSNCGQWKNVGYCTHSHAKFMKDNCAKSCGFCGQ